MKLVNFSHTTDPFSITFDKISRPVHSWREEMSNTVKNIAAATSRPIVLCFSGGIDSEVIALSLIENQIPFTVLTVKQKNNINEYDTWMADNFCKNHNVPQTIVEFDPDDFWGNQIQKYREQGYISWRPWRYFQIHLIELVEAMGACAIIGSGEQIYKLVDSEICAVYSKEYVLCLDYCTRNNLQHYPYFHLQNSELLAAYMKDELAQFLFKHPEYYQTIKHNTSLEKILIYHKYYPEMPRRNKWDGFENTPVYHKFIKAQKPLYPQLIDVNIPINVIATQLGIVDNNQLI